MLYPSHLLVLLIVPRVLVYTSALGHDCYSKDDLVCDTSECSQLSAMSIFMSVHNGNCNSRECKHLQNDMFGTGTVSLCDETITSNRLGERTTT